MISEGEIRVEVGLRAGRVAEVEVRSTRRTDVARGLHGMPLPAARAVIPSLFAVCGEAHAVAAAEACEAALGAPADRATRRLRRRRCALAALDSHAFQRCVAEPRALGLAPAAGPLRRARAATRALREAPATAPAIAELRAAFAAITPEEGALGDDDALAAWARGSPGDALIAAVLDARAEGFGRTTTKLLPALPAAWFAARMRDAAFCAMPAWDGAPAECGPLARAAAHAAVAARGHALLGRLVARLADVRALVAALCDDAEEVEPPVAFAPEPGCGTGLADTARGWLAHQVEIEGGRVRAWRTLAPTEWTFHPRGAVREALLGAPAEDLARRAGWLLLALDACVPCAARVREVVDA